MGLEPFRARSVERGILGSALFQKLLKTRRLPTPSATALRILEMADQEDCSFVDIANVISSDPAMSARILKFANSAELGAVDEITTVQPAVMRMGLRAVKVTALSFSLMSERDSEKCPGFDANLFWAHSLATAVAARALIDQQAPVTSDEAFVAGLLSRIGKLVFAVGAPEQYAIVLKTAGSVLDTTLESERAVLDTDHVEIGGALLAGWKVPQLLVDAMRQDADAEDAKAVCLGRAIAAAHIVADHLCGLTPDATPLLSLGADGLAVPSDETTLGEWIELIEQIFRDVAGGMSVSLDELPDRFELQSRAADLITELSITGEAESQTIQAENRTLLQRATTDPLTGLHNRAAFDQRLKDEIERNVRYGRPFTLIMLDVDHFKAFNDTHGHLVGDGVLKLVARTCRDAARDVDFTARYGGEEFAIIAPETGLKPSAVLAERVRREIEGRRYEHEGAQLRITASLGVAAVENATDGITAARVIKAADAALYEAKRSGRNRCCFTKYAATPEAPAGGTSSVTTPSKAPS